MSALVSIVIPVYNLEVYIENCLTKTVNQTYENLEIICVDDGSSDSSAQIIKSFAAKDKRVRYVYQDNAGVSAARNKGLDVATGEYVMFVDGDDYLHYMAVEVFLKAINETDADVACAYYKPTDDLNESMDDLSECFGRIADDNDLFCEHYGTVIIKSSCSKLYKAEFARSVRFNSEFSTGEDANYVIRILHSGAKFAIVDKPLYYYYTRENSCVTSSFNKKKFSITNSFDDLCELLKDSEYGFLKGYCLQYLFQTICYNRTMAIGTDAEAYVLVEGKRIGRKWIKDFIKCKDIDIKNRLMFTVFYYSRSIYELARMIQDPTMKDFYKSRKAERKE